MRLGPSRVEAPAGLVLATLAMAAAASCRRAPETTPSLARLDWEYCWWTVRRSPLPHDTVAARFRSAFAAVGLTGVRWTSRGDTIWVAAGPSELPEVSAGAGLAGRAVSYDHGDSTRFRFYTAVVAPEGGWASSADSARVGSSQLDLCTRIARAAAVPSSAPRDPNGEETAPVWRQVP